MFDSPPRRRSRWLPAVTLVAALVTGCAHFPDSGPRDWRDKPEYNGPLAQPPRVPEQDPGDSTAPSASPAPGKQPPPGGCDDPDPLVVATCLDPVSSVAPLPDDQYTLVAQRASGRILKVAKGKPTVQVATVPVDPAGGGLKGITLSPYYDEDHLIYAYGAAGGDQRLFRVTFEGQATPVLTGIPSTPGNDSGAVTVSKEGALVIATGADGSAGNPRSLAGKILRVDTFGRPFPGNPDPRSPVYSSGLQTPGGLCAARDSGAVWVTDRRGDRDALYKVRPGPLGDPAWNWPDRPGVAGCVVQPELVAVAERGAGALFVLQKNKLTDSFTGTPTTMLTGTYGRLSPVAPGAVGFIWLGTENKGRGGRVVPSDDRVIHLPLVVSGAGGAGPD